jgi:membrane protease YdiL (CAAX protease family)
MVVGALVVGGGAVVVVAAWSLVVDLGALEVPATLDPRSEAAREADLPVRQDIAVDAAFVVTAALVVLGALVSEVVVRGYMFPALAGWCGRWVAGAVVAVIFAALMGGLAVPALLVGAALCVVYLWSGSLLPTITVTAGLGGTLLAGACDFGAAAIALTAVACAASALALALVPTALARTA